MGVRFALFILFPLLELWVLLKVGAAIGALAALGLVVASAVLGIAVLRLAGWQTLLSSRGRLLQGQSPAPELFNGFILAAGGALLLLPGLIGDVIGLLLLLPSLRRRLALRLFRRTPAMAAAPGAAAGPVVIEGEYRREP